MRRPSPCSTDVRGVIMADETDRKDDKTPKAEKSNTEGPTERSQQPQANPEAMANAPRPAEAGRRLKLNPEAFVDLPPLPDLDEVAVVVLRERTLRERIVEGLG